MTAFMNGPLAIVKQSLIANGIRKSSMWDTFMAYVFFRFEKSKSRNQEIFKFIEEITALVEIM